MNQKYTILYSLIQSMHKNSLILILFLFSIITGWAQNDFLYKNKRTKPYKEPSKQTLSSQTNNNTLYTYSNVINSPLQFFRPINMWRQNIFHYQNYLQRSSYFLSNYNWQYNTYYHVNNPWLRNSPFSSQYRSNPYWIYYTPITLRRSIPNVTARKINTKHTPSNIQYKQYDTKQNQSNNSTYFKKSKKGRQNGFFNNTYHKNNSTQRSSSIKQKKKY